MSRARRKKQIRNRIIAFVMAVAMVFTVVKVNDSKKEVKAGEGDTSAVYTDNSFLDNILDEIDFSGSTFDVANDQLEIKTYTIKYQNGEYKFSVSDSNIYVFNEYYYLEGGTLKKTGNVDDAGDNYIPVMCSGKVAIYNGEEKVDYCKSTDTTTSLRFAFERTSLGVYQNLDTTTELYSKTNEYITANPSATKPILNLVFSKDPNHGCTTATTGEVIDNWEGGAIENDLFYGHNEFVLITSSTTPTEEDIKGAESFTARDINTGSALNNYSDGTYTVYHRYVTGVDDGSDGKISFTTLTSIGEISVDKLHAKITYQEEESSNIFTIYDSVIPKDETIGYILPTHSIEISVTTDDSGSVTMSGDATGSETLVQGDNGYSAKVTIPALANTGDNYKGVSKTYHFVVGTTTKNHSFDLTVNYLSLEYGFSSITIDGVSAGTYDAENKRLISSTSPAISAIVKHGDGLTMGYTSVGLYSDALGTNKISEDAEYDSYYSADSCYYATYTPTFPDNYFIDGEISSFYIIAKNINYNNNSVEHEPIVSGPYYFQLDTTAPAVDNVVVKQKNSYGDYTNELTGKATAMRDTRIEFTLTETGAGMASGADPDFGYVLITNNGLDGADVSRPICYDDVNAVYYAEIPSTVLNKNNENYKFIEGTSLTYKIIPKDSIGNTIATDTATERTIEFYDDKATEVTIDMDFTPVLKDETGRNYYDNSELQMYNLYFKVTITSKVELSDLKVNDNGNVKDFSTIKADDTYNREVKSDGTIEYTFLSSYINPSDLASLGTGDKRTITVTATNENGYSVADVNETFYVDLDKPDIAGNPTSLTGNTSPTGDATEVASGLTTWNKDVYIIIHATDFSDAETYDSGLADPSFTVTGATQYSVDDENKIYVYKVDQSNAEETGALQTATVVVSVFDKLGNQTDLTGKFNIDTTKPTITIDDEVLSGSGENIEATVTDNYQLASVRFAAMNAEKTAELGSPATAINITEISDDNKYTFNLGTLLGTEFTSGHYPIKITATDHVGNVSEKIIDLEIDITHPYVGFDVITGTNNLSVQSKTTGIFSTIADYSYSGGSSTPGIYQYYKAANHPVDVGVLIQDKNLSTCSIGVKKDGEENFTDITNSLEFVTNDDVKTATATFSEDGHYVLQIDAADALGNTTTNTIEFTIDKTNPEFSILLNNATPVDYYNSDVAVTYDCVEANLDVDDVWIKSVYTPLTGDVVTNNYAKFSDEGTVTSFSAEGTYEISIKGTDLVNNASAEVSKTFVIDKNIPDIYVSGVNGVNAGKGATSVTHDKTHGGTLEECYFGEHVVNYYGYYRAEGTTTGVTVTFEAHDINFNEAGNAWIHIYDKIGSTEPVEITPVVTESSGVYTATALISTEGNHKVYAVATDLAGNSYTSESVEFAYDITPPAITVKFGSSTAVSGLRQKDSVKVSYDYTETNWDANNVQLKYIYTPAGGTAGSEQTISDFVSQAFPIDATQGDGKYSVKIVATDLAGNVTTTDSYWFIIDGAAPQIKVASISGTSPKQSKFYGEYTTKYKGSNIAYNYGKFYNGESVKLTINVFDYDINANTIKVYDNNKEVTAKVTPVDGSNNTEYTIETTISGEGSHQISISVKDIYGNEATDNYISFTIDNTDPELSLQVNDEEPVAMTRYDGNVKVSYSLDDKNIDDTDVTLTYVFTPAGGAKQDAVGELIGVGKTRTFTENGTYEVTIKAVDKAGRYKSASTSFVIDKAKPEIDLKITTSKPAKFDKYKRTYKPAVEGYFTTAKDGYEYGQYYKENVKIQISVFDYDAKWTAVYDNDELVDVEFKYQGGGLYTADFTISGEGSHVIKAESADKSGNRGESSELSFIIDKTAPDLTTTLNSEKYSDMDAFFSKDAVVGISVEDDNEDADDIYRVSVTALSDGSDTITDSAYVKEGQETYKKNAYYTVTYTVIDRAGNSSTAKVGFTIDTTRPQSDIKITTKDPAKIAKYNNKYSNTNGHFNTEYTYGQYYNETVAMDMAVFDYNADKIVVTDNDEVIPVTFVKRGDERVASSITVSSEGEHVVKISVTDKSGNEASNTVSFIIDKSAPSLSATLNNMGSITEQYLASDASVYLSVSDANKDEDDVTRVVKITRPSASTESSTETGALEGTVGYNTEADYEIVYTAIDRAGNESEPITLTFRVDKTAPALSITGITRDATSPENVTITYSMVEDFYWDVESAVVKIYKKVDGMGESPYKTVDFKAGSANSSMSETFEEDGEYRFEFTAKDKTGNEANETFRFILDKNAPIIILSGVDDYLTDKDVTFGVQVDETFYLGNNVKIEGTIKTLENPDGKKLEIDDYTRLTRTSSANFEQIFKEDGIYNIKVTSKDSAGNETVQSVQFTIDKTKPLIKNLEELADEEEYAAYVEATENHEKDAKKLIPIFNEFNFDYDADDIVTDLTTVTYKLYMDGVLYDGLSDVADGFHELRITAEDEVGNTAERTFYFMLDTVKPGIIVTGVEEGDNLMEPTTITVSLQLAEDTLKAVAINGQAVAITNNTATIEVSEKGDYVLVIEAVDDAGNESTMTIKFEYGKTSSWLWLIIAGGAALLIAAAAFFIILGKKRKKNQ